MLSRDELPLAAMLYQVGGREMMGCATFYDPEIAAAYPGRLLMQAALRWAADSGISSVDLNGGHDWMASFADHSEPYYEMVLFSRGLYPALLAQSARRLTRHDPAAPQTTDKGAHAPVAVPPLQPGQAPHPAHGGDTGGELDTAGHPDASP